MPGQQQGWWSGSARGSSRPTSLQSTRSGACSWRRGCCGRSSGRGRCCYRACSHQFGVVPVLDCRPRRRRRRRRGGRRKYPRGELGVARAEARVHFFARAHAARDEDAPALGLLDQQQLAALGGPVLRTYATRLSMAIWPQLVQFAFTCTIRTSPASVLGFAPQNAVTPLTRA